MRRKCSPRWDLRGLLAVALVVASIVSGCGGTRDVADTASATAPDSAATATSDSAFTRPAVPTTIPRTIQRTTRSGTPTAFERPAYARLQTLPVLSDEFVEQFGILERSAWIAGIQRAVVKVGPCSGAIVSEQGLVVTSASCLDRAVGESTAANFDVAFLATPSAERALEGLTVTAVPGDGDSLHVEPVLDVRLVFRPENAVARFGGSFDAGSYPQHRFDVAFVRLYRDDRPLDTPGRLGWATRNPRAGAPVFAAGVTDAPEVTSTGSAGVTVSGGRIRGYDFAATEAPPVGTFYGLFERHFAHGTQPWALPANWLGARADLTLHAPLTLAATNALEPAMLGGALLALDWTYLATLYDANDEVASGEIAGARIVALPATATTHALETVYGARALVQELETGRIPD